MERRRRERTADIGQRTEDRGQGRGQRTEDRVEKREDREQRKGTTCVKCMSVCCKEVGRAR